MSCGSGALPHKSCCTIRSGIEASNVGASSASIVEPFFIPVKVKSVAFEPFRCRPHLVLCPQWQGVPFSAEAVNCCTWDSARVVIVPGGESVFKFDFIF